MAKNLRVVTIKSMHGLMYARRSDLTDGVVKVSTEVSKDIQIMDDKANLNELVQFAIGNLPGEITGIAFTLLDNVVVIGCDLVRDKVGHEEFCPLKGMYLATEVQKALPPDSEVLSLAFGKEAIPDITTLIHRAFCAEEELIR